MENEGNNLAKVLWYYNLLPDMNTLNPKIICPFHHDARPSMLVNLREGNWYCFGCAKSGDAKRFVKLMNPRLNDLQALSKYQRILKSDKVSNVNIEALPKRTRAGNKQLYDEAYDYYHGLSKVNWLSPGDSYEVSNALEYMKKRGFSANTLNKCKAKVTYNKSYGLIFPMLDNGKFRGWVCRTMVKKIEQERKYLYNEGFSRANTLVGNYGSCDYVIVVEGYMDRLKFVQNGIDNVVAILGWKMSKEQEQKLRNAGVKYIISALDNDECGRKGTTYLKTRFKVIRFCYLKGIKDPGEMTSETFDKMYSRTMQKFNKELEKEN